MNRWTGSTSRTVGVCKTPRRRPAQPCGTQPRASHGFTLVELLVAIGIIAILLSILLPALERARQAAFQIKCEANLRNIGQGMAVYESTNDSYLPTSYDYRNTTFDTTGNQQPSTPIYGYVHWSSYIYGSIPNDSFKCPAMKTGGLSPADPAGGGPGNFDVNQTIDSADTGAPDPTGRTQPVTGVDGTGTVQTWLPDAQAPRMAYTLNEGLCGRNKYVLGFQSCLRVYRNVKIIEEPNPSGTILATEFIDEMGIVSGAYDGNGQPTGMGVVCKSQRPVEPFRATGSGPGDTAMSTVCDPSLIDTGTLLRKTTAQDFYTMGGTQSLDPINDFFLGNYSASTRSTRLDWVGRNHGTEKFYVDRKTNFLYLDGHVESKSILQTVPADQTTGTPWEWGSVAHSLVPNTLGSNP